MTAGSLARNNRIRSAFVFVGSPLVGSDLFIANTDWGLGLESLTLRNVIL